MDHQQGPRPRPRQEQGGKSEVDDAASWIRAFDLIREPDCAQAIIDRVEELLWILDHQEDLDADFLAIYGLDLEHVEISAPRYFHLAQRLTAYQGVMAARVDDEHEQTSNTTTRTRSTQPAQQGGSENREVSLTAFRVMFPGIVSGGGNAGGG